MNRRSFLKLLGAASVGTAFAGALSAPASPFLSGIWNTIKRRLNGCRCKGAIPFCKHCKETIIARALNTYEGRAALCQAMVEPIRQSLQYQAVGRKLLLVDELPPGALVRYERDIIAIRSSPEYQSGEWKSLC